jgi:hypothetical protein
LLGEFTLTRTVAWGVHTHADSCLPWLMKHAIKRGAAYRCARQLAAAPTRLGTAPPAQRAISLMREAISLMREAISMMREAIILMREAIGWGRLHLHPRVE